MRKNKLARSVVVLALALALAACLAPAAIATTEGTGVATAYVHLRSGPSTSYSSLTVLAKGAKVDILDKSDDWYKITTADGKTGWSSAKYIEATLTGEAEDGDIVPPAAAPAASVAGDERMTGTAVCRGYRVNVLSGPSITYELVAYMHYTDVGIISAHNNGWYKVTTEDGITGWVNGKYFDVTGKTVAGTTVSASTPAAPVNADKKAQLGSIVGYTPITGDSTYLVLINKETQVGAILSKDAEGYYTVVERTFPVSTGKYGRTPSGTFYISDQYDWRLMKGDVFSQYANRFYGNYLLHSVPYYRVDASSLITGYYNQLGTPASSGCVRMQVDDCKWIYDNCEKGTVVMVIDSGEFEGIPTSVEVDDIPYYVTWDPTDPAEGNPYYGQYK